MSLFVDDADQLRIHEITFTLFPGRWGQYRDLTSLSWKCVELTRVNTSLLPTEAGIYTFVLEPRLAGHPAIAYLTYVGQAKSLRRRFGQYLRSRIKDDKRPHIHYFLQKHNIVQFYYTLVPLSMLNDVEDDLIRTFIPPLNRSIPADISQAVRAKFN